jgi:hypothetical protein
MRALLHLYYYDGNPTALSMDTTSPKKQNSPTTKILHTCCFDGFKRESSRTYFLSEQSNCGFADIVAASQFGMPHLGHQLDKKDVMLQADLARLSYCLIKGQRDIMARVMKQVVAKVHRDVVQNPKNKWKTTVPTTTEEIRSMFMEGKNSIMESIPTPMIEKLESHRYISLEESIRDLLGHGHRTEQFRNNDKRVMKRLSDSAYCVRGMEKCKDSSEDIIVPIFLTEWSDGYDPNGTSKANRHSVWVKVVTLSPPHEKRNDVVYTYPVAVGHGKTSHEEVECRFKKELVELGDMDTKKLFYSKIHGRIVKVIVILVASLMDQPERRSANFMMGGNSTFCARWGFSVNLKELAHRIIPCERCQEELYRSNMNWDDVICSTCTQWRMSGDHKLLNFEPPKDYPVSEIPISGMLPARQLSYEIMTQAVLKGDEMIVQGRWTKAQLVSFLGVSGLNANCSDLVHQHAEDRRTLLMVTSEKENYQEDYETVLKEVDANPGKFQTWKLPALWTRGVVLEQHASVIMHLLFLGVVKTTMKHVQLWLVARGKNTSFLKCVAGLLETIQRYNLGWCKTLPFQKGKHGGWVSENYLAFARIIPWFYLQLNHCVDDETTFEEPTRPQVKWNMKENKKWLLLRGLSGKGNAIDLRTRVDSYMNQEGGPPSLSEPIGGSIEEIQDLVVSMYEMIKSIMVTTVDSKAIQLVDIRIKIFLTRFALFDDKLRVKEKKESWISSYNFPCLLNIPENMEKFGPLTNIWEGGVRGEGFLRYVKTEHSMGLRQDWEERLFSRVLKRKAMENIVDNMENGLEGLNKVGDYSMQMYFKYSNNEVVEKEMKKHGCLSVFKLKNGKWGVHVGIWKYKEIKWTIREMKIQNKFDYLDWRWAENSVNSLYSLQDVEYAGLLLPLPGHPSLYTCIRDDWCVLTAEGTFK